MSIRIENYYDEPVEFPSEIDGWHLDVDRKHFRLSDKPYPGHSGTMSYYLANPSDAPGPDSGRVNRDYLFDIWFAPSVTAIHFLVWARSFEQALELAAEEASNMGFRGVFTDEPRTEADEVDLTYTESGWIISHEWGGSEVGYGDLSRAAVAVCALYMGQDSEYIPNAKRKDPAAAGGEFAVRYAGQREVPTSCSERYEIAEHAAKMGNLRGEAVRAFTTAALAEWEAGEPSAPAPWSGARGGSPKESMLREFDRLNAAGGGRYYVTLADLRDALSDMSRAEFDATLQQLRRDWVLTLSPAEGLHETVPRRVLDAGIKDGPQNLVYVLRRESSQEDEDEASDYDRVVSAFFELSKRQRTPHIMIADVVDETGLSIPRVHAVIRELGRRREGQTYSGDYARATEHQKRASFEVAGRPGTPRDWETMMTVYDRPMVENSYQPNARGGAFDQHAATELELYIENDYKLVGADSSQGKLIEKNLKRKIDRGEFDYERSIDAWAHLIDAGAKSYAKEFGGVWHEMFSPATRRFVAERWAQHFADEHQLRQNARDQLRAGEEAFRLKPGYGQEWASSSERAWEGVYVTETLRRGANNFGKPVGGRVLFDQQVRVVLVSGRYYAQPVVADVGELRQNGRPEAKFQIGDRAQVVGTQVRGKIDYGPFWDEHLGDYKYKIKPDDGSSRRTWNEKSLRRIA